MSNQGNGTDCDTSEHGDMKEEHCNTHRCQLPEDFLWFGKN